MRYSKIKVTFIDGTEKALKDIKSDFKVENGCFIFEEFYGFHNKTIIPVDKIKSVETDY